MAELTFNLQRFGNSDGSKGGGSSDGGHGQNGTNAGSGSGWETRVRKEGEIIFPLFMDTEEADDFANLAWDDYVNEFFAGAVPHYDYADGIAENIDVSRLLGHTSLSNDTFDVINLVDTNVGNIVEYFTFRDYDDALALVFDSGAVLDFDIKYVSPVFNFANGEQMMYSTVHGRWLNGSEIAQAQSFWNAAHIYSATEGVDTLYVSQATNTALLDVTGYDSVVLYDVDAETAITLSQVTDNNLIFTFPNGNQLVVDNSSAWSPDFYFADGSVQYYNRDLDIWSDSTNKEADEALYQSIKAQEELEAAAEAAANKLAFETAAYEAGFDVVCDASDYAEATIFPVSNFTETLVYNASYANTINLYDSLPVNVAGMVETEDYINILFNTGEMLSVGYDYNFSPTFRFGNGIELGYNYRTDTWGTAFRGTDELIAEEADVSVYENSLVYQAGAEDTVYFYDGTVHNVANVSTSDYYIDITFNTGAIASIRYTESYSPDIVFGDDPTTHYVFHYRDGWSTYDTDDLTESADLFEDTTIASDATLSDLVAAPVDSAAVSFNASDPFAQAAAGDFVAAIASANPTHKSA